VLCNMLGSDMENGELPADMDRVGARVGDTRYRNACECLELDLGPGI
jgi:glucuronate isomerase